MSSTDWSTFNNKQNAIGYTPENVANKAINFTSPDDTKYPTTLAVSTELAGKQDLLTNPVTGTGASGQVAFWTGTGTQSGDNGLFWDNSTKNLRINQSTDAGFRLDVNGTARVQDNLTINKTSDARLIIQQNGSNVARLQVVSSVFRIMNEANANLEFWTNTTQRWVISNVGTLRSAGAQTIETSDGDLTLGTSNNGSIVINPNGTGGLRLNNGKNISLGTTTGTKIGTATSQKLAFWNADPIIQPTTSVSGATIVGGGGTTLTDTDTFDGYTLAQIVKALRNMGALA